METGSDERDDKRNEKNEKEDTEGRERERKRLSGVRSARVTGSVHKVLVREESLLPQEGTRG